MSDMVHSLDRLQSSEEEESALESYLFYMADLAYLLMKTMAKAYAWAIAKRTGKGDHFNSEVGPGDHWWHNFRHRHPQISLQKIDMLERSRAEAHNPGVVYEYFQLLGKTLDNKYIKNKPRQIYNCDETFLPLDHSREKAVTNKRSKSSYCQSYWTASILLFLVVHHPLLYSKSFPGGHSL